MRFPIFFLVLVFMGLHSSHGVYVPGDPGAEWTIEEMFAVKHLLHRVTSNYVMSKGFTVVS